MSSTFTKTCVKAKRPIKIGIKEIPPERYKVPKVNLSIPLIASNPIVAINKPIKQPIIPFKIEPLETEVIMLIPKMAKAKYSGLLNCKAILASIGANNTKQKVEKTPPNNDAVVDIDKALPG